LQVAGEEKYGHQRLGEARGFRFESSGFWEFEFDGVAERVEDAEEEAGGNFFGVAVHDGRDEGARGSDKRTAISLCASRRIRRSGRKVGLLRSK